jgi:hypothetical protein
MSTLEWTSFQKVSAELPAGLEGEVFTNSRYQVIKRFVGAGGFGPLWHLSVKRLDKEAVHDWRDLQRIKNELVSPEAEGIELYPAESRLVDGSNQYHLWVFESFRFPFGFDERLVSEASLDGRSKQRPFEEKPKDLLTADQLKWKAKKDLDRLKKR